MTTPAVDQLTEWVREEQADLWHDLNNAIQAAHNGAWSMQTANTARRIIAAARLVGPTPHSEIPWPLVAGGVYHAIYNAGNIPADVLDEAEWQESDALMADSAGTRATEQPRFAATVEAINTERERKWISDLADDDPWADTHPVDQRRPAFRRALTAVQQTWQWWCPTCQQPLPQPRWHRPGQPDGFAYHEAMALSIHRIHRRDTVDPVHERAAAIRIQLARLPALPSPPTRVPLGVSELEDLRRGFEQAARGFASVIQEVWRRYQPALTQVAEVTAQEDTPPSDPMARALWLRRNRNTGPAAPPLDPRRRRR